jgi:hypothetical protein
MLGFDECFQVREANGPEMAVLLDPGIDGAERFGVELVDAMTPFAVLADQVGAAQQAQVLGNCGTGNRESLGDLSGGLAAPAQQVEDGAAGRISQRLKGGLGGSARQICNRTVTHNM